jgi:plasmid stabilization system protein ParE
MLSFFSPDRAARIIEVLVRRIALLERHPQLGRVVSECGPWQLREAVDRWHRKLYRLRADAIEIVTIAPSWMPLGESDPDDE